MKRKSPQHTPITSDCTYSIVIPAAPDPGREALRLTVPVQGGELNLHRDGVACDLQAWHRYPDGRALMAGGVRLDVQDLRVLLHAR